MEILHVYTNDKISEKEIKETISFTIVSKRIKYQGINLYNEVKELYSENYKVLMKEMKDDLNRWRDVPCSWIRRINIVKMTILRKAIYRFNAISIKLSVVFFPEKLKILKCVWKYKKLLITKTILKKNGAGRILFPDFRLFYKVSVIKQYSVGTKADIKINATGLRVQK